MLGQALAVMKRLAKMCPPAPTTEPAAFGTESESTPYNAFAHFALASYLGQDEQSRDVLQRFKDGVFIPGAFFSSPQLYALLSRSQANPDGPPLQIYDSHAAAAIRTQLCNALSQRAERGEQEPLADVPWIELMPRFAEAASFVHHPMYSNVEYFDPPMTTPADVLLTPCTDEELAKREVELGGWLPEDLKEMARVADGFVGGPKNYMYGGWGGVMYMDRADAQDSGECFVINSFPELDDDAICLEGWPANPSAREEHNFLVFPPDVWEALAKAMDCWDDYSNSEPEFKEGDYGFGGVEVHLSNTYFVAPSFRLWIAAETQSLEQRYVARVQDDMTRNCSTTF